MRATLKDDFKGLGGKGSPAGIKLQFFFDVLSSTFTAFDLSSASASDQKYTNNITSQMRKGDLALFDLGYFKLSVLNEFIDLGAFFICRYLHGTTIRIQKGDELVRLDLPRLLRRLETGKAVEFLAHLGLEEILPCRIVAVCLPPDKINERLRRLNKRAQMRGKALSKEEKLLAKWNIFVTNIDSETLSASDVTQAYRLRWSVELLFKQFKSVLKIHEWNHGNSYRLLCEIIATLLVAAIIMTFHGTTQAITWNEHSYKTGTSFEKLFKYFKNNSYKLLDALKLTRKKIRTLFRQFLLDAIQSCGKETRKNRPSALHAVFIQTEHFKVKTVGNKTLLRYSMRN